jgi:hypothetical protein
MDAGRWPQLRLGGSQPRRGGHLVDHRRSTRPHDPGELAENGVEILDVLENVPAPDQVYAAVGFTQPLGNSVVHPDTGCDVGLGGRESGEGASRAVQVAAHWIDAMHREPEPARQLDAVLALPCPDVEDS